MYEGSAGYALYILNAGLNFTRGYNFFRNESQKTESWRYNHQLHLL
jgi:hypothetical protein